MGMGTSTASWVWEPVLLRGYGNQYRFMGMGTSTASWVWEPVLAPSVACGYNRGGIRTLQLIISKANTNAKNNIGNCCYQRVMSEQTDSTYGKK
jgi:hypothetical protein